MNVAMTVKLVSNSDPERFVIITVDLDRGLIIRTDFLSESELRDLCVSSGLKDFEVEEYVSRARDEEF